MPTTTTYMIPLPPPPTTSSSLSDPFTHLGSDLTSTELRETAYEIFIGACRSSGGSRPLTYVSQSSSGRSNDRMTSLQRSVTLTGGVSKVKKALGMKSVKKGERKDVEGIRQGTVGEVMRVQLRIAEGVDSRVRRGLLRIAAGQVV